MIRARVGHVETGPAGEGKLKKHAWKIGEEHYLGCISVLIATLITLPRPVHVLKDSIGIMES